MINQIVQVIAPKSADNPEAPDLGSGIQVGGASIGLNEPWWNNGGTPPKFWWIASVRAESIQALIDWNNIAGNIGWITRTFSGPNSQPNDSDSNKIWNRMRTIILTESGVGHDVWWVSGKQSDGSPDMDDPVMQPTMTGFKALLDLSKFKDRAVLWSGTSTATGPQLNAWVTANNGLGWNVLPALASAEGRTLVRKIAQMTCNSHRFESEAAP